MPMQNYVYQLMVIDYAVIAKMKKFWVVVFVELI